MLNLYHLFRMLKEVNVFLVCKMFNHTYSERLKQMVMRIGNIEVALDIELDLDYLNAGGVSYFR